MPPRDYAGRSDDYEGLAGSSTKSGSTPKVRKAPRGQVPKGASSIASPLHSPSATGRSSVRTGVGKQCGPHF